MRSIYIMCFLATALIFFQCKENNAEIKQSANIETPSYLLEPHRPQFHFTPPANWMNDPNGMVFLDGEYHLFYQYYPDSTVWGPMHWGHAVSKNLMDWEHLPIALYPDSLGLIFSGSAVFDQQNSSGLGLNGKGPLVAIFTHHNIELERAGSNVFQYQSIAFSNDNGRSWTKYENNPVIQNPGIRDFRDPKVIWDEKRNQWVMVFAAYDKALFYTSLDLKNWIKTGEFGIQGDTRLWECPDLFPIQVEETGAQKWVLVTSIQKDAPNGGTATSYFVGDFDGKVFVGDPSNQKWLDYGKDNYAFVTWSNVPDNRILGIGWMSNWQYAQVVPTENWRSAMTLPRELTLHSIDGDYILKTKPADEINDFFEQEVGLSPKIIDGELDVFSINEGNLLSKMDFTFKKPSKGIIDIRIANSKGEYISIGYDAAENHYFIDRSFSGKTSFSSDFADYHIAPRISNSDEIHWTIYLDVASVELFADDGLTSMTEIFFPNENYSRVFIQADSNPVELVSGSYSMLK